VSCVDCPFSEMYACLECSDTLRKYTDTDTPRGRKLKLAACKKWREDNMELRFKVGDKVRYVKGGVGCDALIGGVYEITEISDIGISYLLDGQSSHWCCVDQLESAEMKLCKDCEHCDDFKCQKEFKSPFNGEPTAGHYAMEARSGVYCGAEARHFKAKEEAPKTYTYEEATRLAIETPGRTFKRDDYDGCENERLVFWFSEVFKVDSNGDYYRETTEDFDRKWIEVKE